MKRTPIQEVLKGIKVIGSWGELPPYVTGISQDSRLIRPGYIFLIRKGSSSHGFNYIQEAKQRRAVMVISQEPFSHHQIPLPGLLVPDERETLTHLSHLLFSQPSRRLKLVGVTGTNGKTSTVHIFKSIIEASGEKCGLISTIGYFDGKHHINPSLTTPDIDYITQLLNDMIEEGCRYAVMEVSSHALELKRVEGLHFAAAGYTHLTQDHLDFHHTMEAYAQAKARLFAMLPSDSPALINADCPWAPLMISSCTGKVITYGRTSGDLRVSTMSTSLNGSQFEIDGKGLRIKVSTSLVGEYQGENIACAAGMAWALGIDEEAITRGVENLSSVPGRMEPAGRIGGLIVLVDYAHTPDALRRALENLKKQGKAPLTVVFGCGGDRDKTKRPLMGEVAARLADRVIITSDNPRSEPPEMICQEIYQGIPPRLKEKAIVIVNREEATEFALATAQPEEIILLAGKGAETYQEISGVRHHYDDREVVRKVLNKLGGGIS